MWICPECRQIYTQAVERCERDEAPVAEVFAHQTKNRYPFLGRVVGDRYHLIGGLGQGGLGTVYLAQHRHLGQLFAVKFLDLATIGATTEMDETQKGAYRRDFLREAQVATVIRHPSVVRVSDFGEYEGLPYLVMEYVPGPSLLHMLGTRGRFPVSEALAIARRIAEALDAFHERRLVHRDLKPANVILDPRGDGRLTLVDLGLVKDLSAGARNSTHPLALRGTPGYLAPEQVPPWVLAQHGVVDGTEKRAVDARVDLYALGVILYEMLAGVSPYPDGSNTQIILYACTRDPIPLDQAMGGARLTPELEAFVYATMHRDPDQRPQNAAAFLQQLDALTAAPSARVSWPNHIVPGASGGRVSMRGVLPPEAALAATPAPSVAPAAVAPQADPLDPGQTAALDALSGVDDDSMDATGVYSDGPSTADSTLDADAPAAPGDDIDFDDTRTSVERVKPILPPTETPRAVTAAPISTLDAKAPPKEPAQRPTALIVAAVVLAVALGAYFAQRADAPEAAPAVVRVGADEIAVRSAGGPASAPEPAMPATRAPTTEHAPGQAPQSAAAPRSPSVATASAPSTAPRRAGPTRVPIQTLLADGNQAYQSRQHAKALQLYSEFLRRAGESHEDYWTIHSRVQGLEAMLAERGNHMAP